MKKNPGILCLLAGITMASMSPATAAEDCLPYWKDINKFSIGAQSHRSEVIMRRSENEALTGQFEKSEYYIDLNGTWNFRYFESQTQMPQGMETAPAEEFPDEITVPTNWERQGYGTAIYVNQPYDFCPRNPQPPLIPEENPVGLYRRTFSVPQSWESRAVYLNFCGVKGGAYVYLNGTQVGYAEDSKDLVRYNVTDLLQDGENTLTLIVYHWSTGNYLECQDFWRLSGIERDVYLSSEAKAVNFDFEVISSLDDSFTEGIFELRVTTTEPTDFAYKLLSPDGKSVVLNGAGTTAMSDGGCCDATKDAGAQENGCCANLYTLSLSGSVPGVQSWSAETPVLYTLLMEVNGEYTRFNVGFRRFEICDSPITDPQGKPYRVFLVNGQPVKFKGVNMHEHDPYTGHYVTREIVLEDLRLMREHNINAIRTCHYPLPRYFYELCDSLGFYVYSEANIESHGMGYRLDRTLGNNPEWYAMHEDRILNMYYRTRNYPCVTILSLGNEAGNGVNFYRTYTLLKEMEKAGMNRPVCYERAELEWNTDMIVPQYPGASWFQRMGENAADRPVCPSEYAHAMGNSTGSLDLQWHWIYLYPNLQGGFIWDWVDQGLAETDEDGTPYWTYGGDYGENSPSDANFCCNGIVNPDRSPHPAMAEVKHVYQDVAVSCDEEAIAATAARRGRSTIEVTVTNRFYFRDLSGYRITYFVKADGKNVKKGRIRLSTAPQGSDKVTVRLPRMNKNKYYTIDFETTTTRESALLAKDYVVASDQFVLKDRQKTGYKASDGNFDIYYSDLENPGDSLLLTLATPNASMTFNLGRGAVESYVVAGREYFVEGFGVEPNFWRAPTDNDYGNGAPWRTREWRDAVIGCTAQVTTEAGRAVLKADYSLQNGHPYSLEFALLADGILTVKAELGGVETRERPVELPRMGVTMRLPGGATDFNYYGRGPEENYWDRNTGTLIGLYTSNTASEYYPYVRPQECGHHTDCRWINIGDLTFVADGTMEFNALNCTTADLDCANNTDRPYQWNWFTPNEEHNEEAVQGRLRRQTHVNDVTMKNFTELSIDLRQSGVGGYDSWGSRPERERTLWGYKDYTLKFAIVPQSVLPESKAVNYIF